MDALTPRRVSPGDPGVRALIGTHLELMYASSPACSIHAMDGEALSGADAQFFAIFDGDQAVAMGALKSLASGEGELKSMHVRQERRGQGLADAMLTCLLDAARASGMGRVSLETGSQEVFKPARAFYARNGFEFCPPFEGYVEDPNSVFMTRTL